MPFKDEFMKNILYVVGVFWVTGYITLLGIPDMGSVRNLFSLIGLLHIAVLLKGSKPVGWPKMSVEVLSLCLLSAWLVVQSAFFSNAPLSSLSEQGSEWGKLILMAVLGGWLVIRGQERGLMAWLPVGLLLGYFSHVVATLAYQAWGYFSSGHLLLGYSFLGNYGYVSPAVSVAWAFLLGEFVLRLRGYRWLPFSNVWVGISLLCSLLALLALNSKAALVSAFVLLMLLVGVLVASLRLRRSVVWLLLLSVLLVSIISVVVNPRWHGAYDAVMTTLNGPIDLQPFAGAVVKQVDESFYVRAEYGRIGVQGILEHPLGLGYGSDAFGRYMVELGAPLGMVSSHSGWLDFALANGVVGLALFLLLLFLLMRRGWLAFISGSEAGLILMFVILNFAVRSLLDGHLFGSRFVGSAFVVGVLWAFAVTGGKGAVVVQDVDQ